MYDSLSSSVVREMFGSESDDEELDFEDDEVRLFSSAPVPSAAGLASRGFSVMRGGKKKAATAAFAGVDPRVIDARKSESRKREGRHRDLRLGGGASFGFGGGLDSLGQSVVDSMFDPDEVFGVDDDDYGLDEDYGRRDLNRMARRLARREERRDRRDERRDERRGRRDERLSKRMARFSEREGSMELEGLRDELRRSREESMRLGRTTATAREKMLRHKIASLASESMGLDDYQYGALMSPSLFAEEEY